MNARQSESKVYFFVIFHDDSFSLRVCLACVLAPRSVITNEVALLTGIVMNDSMIEKKKRIERLREKLRQSSWSVTDLHSGAGGKTSGGNNRVHRVFVDSPTQVERFSAEEYFDTPRELIPMIGHRLRRQNLIDLAQQSRGEEDVSSLLSSKSNRTSKTKTAMEAKELTEREKRCSRIDVNIQRLELQQHLMVSPHLFLIQCL